MQRKLVGDLDHLFKLAVMRSHPMYCPLTDQMKEVRCVVRIFSSLTVYYIINYIFMVLLKDTTVGHRPFSSGLFPYCF